MELLQEDMWQTFIDKAEELFVFGYKLPSTLQVKAVIEVQNKLVDWKSSLSNITHSDNSKNSAICDAESCVDSLDNITKTRTVICSSNSNSLDSRNTTRVKRGRPRKRKGKQGIHKDNKKTLSYENRDESVENVLSQSEGDNECNTTNEDSNKNCVTEKSDSGDVQDHPRRHSQRIKIRRRWNVESDNEGTDTDSSLRKSVMDETTVKLEVTENTGWKNDKVPSADDKKPTVHRKVGRPRKYDSVLHDIFENLNLAFKCAKCCKSYGTSELLECHMEAHKDKMPFVCLKCNKSYTSKSGFDNHIRSHDPNNQIQCPYCEVKHPTYTVLNRHVLINHVSASSRPFLCDLCGKGFIQPSALKVHMNSHAVEKNFACDQCKFRTHSKHILVVHKKNMHSDKEYYTCDLCDVRVKYKSSLIEHKRRHFGERPHRCSICSSAFPSRSQLAQHIKIHKERTCVCDQCNKKFIDRHKLARHMAVHTGKKEYSCGFCNYQCNVRSNMRKHWLFVHKIDHDRRGQRVKVINANGVYEEKMVRSSPDTKKRHEKELDVSTENDQLKGQCSVADDKQTGGTGLKSVTEEESEGNHLEAKYSDGTVFLPEMTACNEVYQRNVQVLPVSADLTSVLSETELSVDGMAGGHHQTISETVIEDGKVLELPAASNNFSQDTVSYGIVAQDGVYSSDLGLETKVEMSEDGTQYVYVYFPVDQLSSQSTVPAANTEEYVVTVEETETQHGSIGLHNVM